jgi:hypothetical protein
LLLRWLSAVAASNALLVPSARGLRSLTAIYPACPSLKRGGRITVSQRPPSCQLASSGNAHHR